MSDKTKAKFPSPKLHKFIFQIRYKPLLEFYTLLFPLATKISGYPNWTTDRLSVVLKNFDNRTSIGLRHDNLAYERDNDISAEEEKSVLQLFKHLTKEIGISKFTRVGYRKMYLNPVDMGFQELVDILHLKLFSQDKTLLDILSAKASDLQYVVDAVDKDIKYHFRFGPVVKGEISRFLQFNEENHLDPLTRAETYRKIVEAYPNVALYSDIDMYIEKPDINPDEGLSFYEIAGTKLDVLIKATSNYLLGH